jgi:hypothetical protein
MELTDGMTGRTGSWRTRKGYGGWAEWLWGVKGYGGLRKVGNREKVGRGKGKGTGRKGCGSGSGEPKEGYGVYSACGRGECEGAGEGRKRGEDTGE